MTHHDARERYLRDKECLRLNEHITWWMIVSCMLFGLSVFLGAVLVIMGAK